jgi:hypothetical protein
MDGLGEDGFCCARKLYKQRLADLIGRPRQIGLAPFPARLNDPAFGRAAPRARAIAHRERNGTVAAYQIGRRADRPRKSENC